MNSNEAEWKEINCLSGRIMLRIPKQLIEQSYEKIEKRFPYDSKPQEVRMDEDGNIILTLNLLEKQLEEGQLTSATEEVQRMITRIYPESMRSYVRYMKTEAGMAGWFSFVTGGVADDNCHIMFLMSVSGKMMLGSYHFPVGHEQEEKENFFNILRSMQVIQPEKIHGESRAHGSRI